MRYFLIAGEASGDLHAAGLIERLRAQDAEAEFRFFGGDLMAEAAGTQPVVHYRDMAYMGFVEVAKHAGAIMRNFKAARKAIADFKPDCLILIDYPSFNLKMAKYAKALDIKVFYYISPKVWAWKEWRVKTIKKVVDKVFAIFPFEVGFYAKHGVEVEYVGNPSVAEIDFHKQHVMDRKEFIAANRLQDKPIVALMPGSRLAEIKRNLPIMDRVMRRFPQYRGVVAGAPGIDHDVYAQYTRLPVVTGQTYDLLANSRAALVTSGTATLETALWGIPQIAMYRNNGKRWMRSLKDKFLKVRYVTLPNLVSDREIIPELLFDQCNDDTVANWLGRILPEREARQRMLADYADLAARLGTSSAPQNTASAIISLLKSV